MGQGRPLHTPTVHKRPWRNHLPVWIEQDPAWHSLGHAARAVLQAIADACDPPDAHGNLVGAFGGAAFFLRAAGVSRRTYWRAVDRLCRAGFLVLLGRGGRLRTRVRGMATTAGNAYGIPGARGGLDQRRSLREVVRIVEDADGRRVRLVTQPGDQASFWPPGDTTLVSRWHYPGVTVTLPQCHPDTLPSHVPSPVPPPVMKNHEASCARDGGFAARRGSGRGKRHPGFGEEDLREDRRVLALFWKFREAGWVTDGEADCLWFFAAVEHALRVATRSPCGMLVSLLRNRGERSLFVTQEDEDRAVERLRRVRA